MKAFIKLKLKENISKSSFFFFAIIGVLISLFVIGNLEISSTTMDLNNQYQQYGYQWTILSLIASFASLALYMGNFKKHRESQDMNLLRLHGLNVKDQYWGMVLSNILISCLMALMLLMGMLLSLVFKGINFSFVPILGAIALYLIGVATTSLLISLLSIIFSPSIVGLVGIFLVLLGSLHGTLSLILANAGDIKSKIGLAAMRLVPALDSYSRFARDMFFSEFTLNQSFYKY